MKKRVPVIQITKTPILVSLGCLFLMVAVAFIAPPSSTQAQSFDVSAQVNAPLPTSPAVITSPVDQQEVTTSPITVSGTCGDGTYVSIFREGIFAGMAACTGGVFSLQINLAEGPNQLQAKVYNSTNNEGPQSPAITVYYRVPLPSETSSALQGIPFNLYQRPSATEPATPGKQLIILYSPNYRTYKTGELWQGEIGISGGTSPFTITINWGDGSLYEYKDIETTSFRLSHSFSKPGTYQPIIHVSDSKGSHATLQLLIPVVASEAKVPASTTPPIALLLALLVGILLLAIITTELGLGIGTLLSKGSPTSKK